MTRLSQLSSALTKLGSLKAAIKVASLIKVAFSTPNEFRVVFNILLKGGSGADKVIGPLRHAMRQHKEMADEVLASLSEADEMKIRSMLYDPNEIDPYTEETAAQRNAATSSWGVNPDTGEPRQPHPWNNWQGTNDPSNEDGFWDDEEDDFEDEQEVDWRISALKDAMFSIIAIGSRWLESNYQKLYEACQTYNESFDYLTGDLEAFIAFDATELKLKTKQLLWISGLPLPRELFTELAVETRRELAKIYAEEDNAR